MSCSLLRPCPSDPCQQTIKSLFAREEEEEEEEEDEPPPPPPPHQSRYALRSKGAVPSAAEGHAPTDDKDVDDADRDEDYRPPVKKPRRGKTKVIPEKTIGIKKCQPRHRKYKCKQCDMEFISQDALNKHIEEKHPTSRPFQCAMCGKDHNSEAALRKHLITHQPPTNFCDTCGKGFHFVSALVHHWAIHSNERKFQCAVGGCGKKFKTRHARTVHERKHSGEQHKCTYQGCKYETYDVQYLWEHERQEHNGNHLRVCQLGCGFTGKYRWQMLKHEAWYCEKHPSATGIENKDLKTKLSL